MAELNILGVLPARGGSKGLPGKNLREISGRPLLAWAADAIQGIPEITQSICTTDDDRIAEIAIRCGLEVPFMRPAYLASDEALIQDVLIHALDELDDIEYPFTHILLVQATSPNVTKNDVREAIKLIHESGADTVIAGFKVGMHHPSLMFKLVGNNKVAWLFSDGKHMARRQDFPEVFIRTGLLYLISTEVLRTSKSMYGENIQSLIVDEERAITIDNEADFFRAQEILEKHKND
ncbi:MAG: hypothetical protein CMP91_12440 [Gammaproteobacteria bacterium]|nr:hypothetical protein [Gammaproteobacteria bacterium]|tara:strand:- start:6270 stop:6977 length:708 start_codon:yes stop_codon:yes gene_type:complete